MLSQEILGLAAIVLVLRMVPFIMDQLKKSIEAEVNMVNGGNRK